MGLLQQNLNKYTRIYESKQGYISDTMMKEWFGKSADKRTELKDMSFNKRSAVVMVGVSGSGKTHFARQLIKQFPGFVLCSHDECYAKAMVELNTTDEYALDYKMTELLEKMLKSAVKNNQNVIFDGLFVSPVVRAALIETLKKFGYEVHVVYITLQTLVDTLAQKVAMKAIQTKAHRLYCLKHKNALTAQRMITIRNQAIALYAEDNGLTEDEVISLFLKDPNVIAECKRGAEAAMNEVEMHGVQHQEATNAFMLGADYYYEI